jgi:hypothetical protein
MKRLSFLLDGGLEDRFETIKARACLDTQATLEVIMTLGLTALESYSAGTLVHDSVRKTIHTLVEGQQLETLYRRERTPEDPF